jgi:hypothetical protein
MPILIGGAILGAGALGAGASIFGGVTQANEEQNAINAQKQLYAQGLGTQQGYVNEAASTIPQYLSSASGALSPFISGGQGALNWYDYLTGTGGAPAGATGPSSYNPLTAPLTAPFTAATLSSTPGYQFTLGQGLQSTQNSYAAQGLGSSGAALKGAASYATGLANSTYNSQFANYLTQNQQIANILLGSAGIGANAAGTLAGIYGNAGNTLAGIYGSAGNAALGGATQTGAGVASSTAGIGNAAAGAAAGVAGAGASTANSLAQYTLLNQLLQNNANNSTVAGSTNPLTGNPYTFGAFASNPLAGGSAAFTAPTGVSLG